MGQPMTTAITPLVRGYGSVDCGGAHVRAHCRHLATVVTVRGEIDVVNVAQVSEYVRRFVLDSSPVVLDLSDLSHFSSAGIGFLWAVDEECRSAGVEWTIVGNSVVNALLCDDAGEPLFPVAGSVHQALRSLADGIAWRRQLVLPFVRKSA